MAQHQIVNPGDHGELRFLARAGADLGDAEMACYIVPSEFRRLAVDYPIVFRFDTESRTFCALALLGFEPGENLYLNGDQWDASTRPLAMAVRPFLVGRSRDGEGPGQVHVDMEHPRIIQAGDGGVRLFDDAGQPSAALEEIAAMLGALDEGHRGSTAFYAALARYDLLESFAMDVTLGDGSPHRLVGYHLIHEEKLNALEPAILAELHGQGYLEPIYMAMASLGNVAKLARRKKKAMHG